MKLDLNYLRIRNLGFVIHPFIVFSDILSEVLHKSITYSRLNYDKRQFSTSGTIVLVRKLRAHGWLY